MLLSLEKLALTCSFHVQGANKSAAYKVATHESDPAMQALDGKLLSKPAETWNYETSSSRQ